MLRITWTAYVTNEKVLRIQVKKKLLLTVRQTREKLKLGEFKIYKLY